MLRPVRTGYPLDIVIPSADRPGALATTLGALREAGAPLHARDIVVVTVPGDTSSMDVVARFASADWRMRFTEVPQPRGNASVARNAGIACTTSPYILFMDNDVEVSRGFFADLQRHLAEYPSSALLPRVDLSMPHSSRGVKPDLRLEWLEAAETQRWPWRLFWSTCFCCPRTLCERGFTTIYRGWGQEDVDFGYRLYQCGHTITYCPALKVIHHVGRSPRNPFTRRERGKEGCLLPFIDNTCRFILRYEADHELARYFTEVELPWFCVGERGTFLLQDKRSSDGRSILRAMLHSFAERNSEEVGVRAVFERKVDSILDGCLRKPCLDPKGNVVIASVG